MDHYASGEPLFYDAEAGGQHAEHVITEDDDEVGSGRCAEGHASGGGGGGTGRVGGEGRRGAAPSRTGCRGFRMSILAGGGHDQRKSCWRHGALPETTTRDLHL